MESLFSSGATVHRHIVLQANMDMAPNADRILGCCKAIDNVSDVEGVL